MKKNLATFLTNSDRNNHTGYWDLSSGDTGILMFFRWRIQTDATIWKNNLAVFSAMGLSIANSGIQLLNTYP